MRIVDLLEMIGNMWIISKTALEQALKSGIQGKVRTKIGIYNQTSKPIKVLVLAIPIDLATGTPLSTPTYTEVELKPFEKKMITLEINPKEFFEAVKGLGKVQLGVDVWVKYQGKEIAHYRTGVLKTIELESPQIRKENVKFLGLQVSYNEGHGIIQARYKVQNNNPMPVYLYTGLYLIPKGAPFTIPFPFKGPFRAEANKITEFIVEYRLFEARGKIEEGKRYEIWGVIKNDEYGIEETEKDGEYVLIPKREVSRQKDIEIECPTSFDKSDNIASFNPIIIPRGFSISQGRVCISMPGVITVCKSIGYVPENSPKSVYITLKVPENIAEKYYYYPFTVSVTTPEFSKSERYEIKLK